MKHLFLSVLLVLSSLAAQAKDYSVKSPDGQLTAIVHAGNELTWEIRHGNTTVLAPSSIGLVTSAGQWGRGAKVSGTSLKNINSSIETPIYKRNHVTDRCQELTLRMSGGFNLIVRAYDDCCAYRLQSTQKKSVRVINEQTDFVFADDYKSFVPYVNDNRAGERYCYSFESYYDEAPLSQMYADSLAITPLAVCLPGGMKAVVMETAVENYPGMFLKRGTGHSLVSEHAPLPLKTVIGGFDRLNLIPVERANYIADLQPRQALPWRMVMVTTNDTQLISTDTPYCLAPQCRLSDTSWIKPGKVAWDWWNNWNLTGVDFKTGINTDTYLYYIDFASKNNLEYVIIDEGWSSEENLFEFVPELDIPRLIAYGGERGVGIILWTSWRNLSQDTEKFMSHYAKLGVKGFKVDFFDRDDQQVIASAYDVAACAARHHLLLDYHGLKPTGIQRAYPHILNHEGVKGLENSKWEPRNASGPVHDMPRYDVTAPYLRMLPGPMDYTPGAMKNATRDCFFGNNNHPMSQGTRVHQMAMYVIYDAPLQMLADSPSMYMKEQECTDFMAQVPTVFDETVALAGEMGEYVVTARRKGNLWYIGALNNWTERDITISFDALRSHGSMLESFADGVNAAKEATDYKHSTSALPSSITIHLAPGGGWAAVVR